jgi:hypothetical protein
VITSRDSRNQASPGRLTPTAVDLNFGVAIWRLRGCGGRAQHHRHLAVCLPFDLVQRFASAFYLVMMPSAVAFPNGVGLLFQCSAQAVMA